MHENMKTSMWHTGRSERTCRLPACFNFSAQLGNEFTAYCHCDLKIKE